MRNLERILKTRKALRAAAAVAVAISGGCMSSPDVFSPVTALAADVARGDRRGEVDAASLDGRGRSGTPERAVTAADDASAVAADDAVTGLASADVSAVDGARRCDPKDGWKEYEACCEAIGWDFKQGCMAWGPPAPAAMPAPASTPRPCAGRLS